jgi:hypothetical protein
MHLIRKIYVNSWNLLFAAPIERTAFGLGFSTHVMRGSSLRLDHCSAPPENRVRIGFRHFVSITKP